MGVVTEATTSPIAQYRGTWDDDNDAVTDADDAEAYLLLAPTSAVAAHIQGRVAAKTGSSCRPFQFSTNRLWVRSMVAAELRLIPLLGPTGRPLSTEENGCGPWQQVGTVQNYRGCGQIP